MGSVAKEYTAETMFSPTAQILSVHGSGGDGLQIQQSLLRQNTHGQQIPLKAIGFCLNKD